MRIGIVSDTHIQNGRPALPAPLAQALAASDLILHAGDLADESALAAFKALGPQLIAVAGNVDRGHLLKILPERTIINTPFGDIALMHILPMTTHNPRQVIQTMLPDSPNPLAVIHGHTHRPEILQVRRPIKPDESTSAPTAAHHPAFIINPGSPLRSRGHGHTFAILEVTESTATARIEHLA